MPLACDVPEPIPVARLVLRRNQTEIPAHRLGMWEAMRIIDEGGHSLCRANTNSRDAAQASDGRRKAARAT